MKTLQAEAIVDEVQLTRHGSHATVTLQDREMHVLGVIGNGSLEGHLTIHNADVKPGQRVQVELRILDADYRRVQPADTASISHV